MAGSLSWAPVYPVGEKSLMRHRSVGRGRQYGGMNLSGPIVMAVVSTAVVVAGVATVAALALLPAQSSGPIANVASIVISPRATPPPTPRPTSTPDDSGGAVPVVPAGPTTVHPEPESTQTEGGDDGGNSGKGTSGGNG